MAVTINGSAGVTTNAGGSVNPSTNVEGINYSCRAWVNFNGTGTVAIRASGNVSSITDGGTGTYTINFTTAMSDVNYTASGYGSAVTTSALFQFENGTVRTTSAYKILTINFAGTDTDATYVNLAFFR
jgi:hypothetical protein